VGPYPAAVGFEGKIEAIYLAAIAGGEMSVVDEVEAVKGLGLRGEHHARPDQEKPGREVTLVESEAVAAIAAESGFDAKASDTRRNLVTVGVPLNHLVGQEFSVGEVVLRGVRLCEPCQVMEATIGEGARMALLHRGGLRADIVRGGTVRVGDRIAPVNR
jgi:MOSC domain-containing protein YiiM